MANRAWLYCRIGGGHEHEERELLDNQEQQLLDYCAQQGLQVVGTTKVSGSGTGDLEKLTGQGIEQGCFDFLVTVSASRLKRRCGYQSRYVRLLQGCGWADCHR